MFAFDSTWNRRRRFAVVMPGAKALICNGAFFAGLKSCAPTEAKATAFGTDRAGDIRFVRALRSPTEAKATAFDADSARDIRFVRPCASTGTHTCALSGTTEIFLLD